MKIDAFAHALPVEYKEAFQKKLPRDVPKMSGGDWDRNKTLTDVSLRLAIMDDYEVDMQVISTPTPPMEWLFDAPTGAALARIANDGMAEIVERHPKRFLGVATVCLLDVEGAINELQRSIRELKLRGVLIYSNIGGHPLDAPEFDEFYFAVEELAVPIWLHPARSQKQPDYPGEESSCYLLWQAFGWPYETTLAMARLVFSGALKRHPNLRIIVHHAGAMVPFFAGRIRSIYSNPSNLIHIGLDPQAERPYLDQFRDFYVDSWTNGSLAALMTSYEMFGADRMVFGTDMPFGAEMGRLFVREAAQSVERMIRANLEANQFIKNRPKESQALFAKLFELTAEESRQLWELLAPAIVSDGLIGDLLKIQVAQDAKILKRPDLTEGQVRAAYDLRLTEKVAKEMNLLKR